MKKVEELTKKVKELGREVKVKYMEGKNEEEEEEQQQQKDVEEEKDEEEEKMEIKREKKKEKRKKKKKRKKKRVVKMGLMKANGGGRGIKRERDYRRCGEEGLDELLWTVELDSPKAVCGEMVGLIE